MSYDTAEVPIGAKSLFPDVYVPLPYVFLLAFGLAFVWIRCQQTGELMLHMLLYSKIC